MAAAVDFSGDGTHYRCARLLLWTVNVVLVIRDLSTGRLKREETGKEVVG